MSRITIKDDENLSAGAGVEGRRQKKKFDTDIEGERGKKKKTQGFGSLKFDTQKNADIFESEPR
ncbi:MAG: hypothetical protein XE11_1900 [Methanomicrobiales archaeon 53_19]|jgi:hypothetical protein|uniref:hypothetical protein n=1 Tax=Methanocalculus sp. TaxID=2004547 RepID=UPI000747AEED|nr:hypothetical protein [Methanocalculus sp.]KUL02101.1 MAG: hypothetical protein XE11_1900 [Methanomicrobiales archaeon 53_19]HIJ07233.1 hypothetical protein [Methanocalculus sp.]